MRKEHLVREFRDLLEDRLRSLKRMRDAARSGMRVDEGHRPSNRGERAAVTSQGYLAAGLNSRIDSLEADLLRLTQVDSSLRAAVSAGALVSTIDGDGREQRFLLLPGAQGDLIGDGKAVTAVSPASPIGRGLLTLEEGDTAEVTLGGRQLEFEILAVE